MVEFNVTQDENGQRLGRIISAKYGFPTNILPVNAQIPPIIEKTIPVPNTNIIICNKVRIGFASENPPI